MPGSAGWEIPYSPAAPAEVALQAYVLCGQRTSGVRLSESCCDTARVCIHRNANTLTGAGPQPSLVPDVPFKESSDSCSALTGLPLFPYALLESSMISAICRGTRVLAGVFHHVYMTVVVRLLVVGTDLCTS